MEEFKKILIINPFGIGDVLFTTPAIRAIKNRYPKAFIGYWCNERVEQILKNNPNIDRIFALSRGDLKKIFQKSKLKGMKESLRLFSEIKKEHFDISFDVSLDYRYNLISWLAGIEKRIGLNYKNRSKFLTHKIDIVGFDDKHVVEYYLDVLKFLNIGFPDSPKIELHLSKENCDWAAKFLQDNGIEEDGLLIGIAPGGGASWGGSANYLRWPEQKFAALSDILIKKHSAKIILFGSAEESEICNRIAPFLSKQAINIAGKLTLSQFVALFSKCKVIVCNDAGPLHVAVGLGVKTVCICGPVDEKVYGPFPYGSQNNRLVKKDLSCRPCYKRFRMADCSKQICLEEISPEDALKAVEELI